MTLFNPDNKQELTYGESLGPAMDITEQADADQYFEKLVQYYARTYTRTDMSKEEIARYNLGYYAGYYSIEVMKRVEKLFLAPHPILGSASTILTPEQIIARGIELGKNLHI